MALLGIFETFTRSRAGTKTIKSESDFDSGWNTLKDADKATLTKLFTGVTAPSLGGGGGGGGKETKAKKKAAASKKRKSKDASDEVSCT